MQNFETASFFVPSTHNQILVSRSYRSYRSFIHYAESFGNVMVFPPKPRPYRKRASIRSILVVCSEHTIFSVDTCCFSQRTDNVFSFSWLDRIHSAFFAAVDGVDGSAWC